jgi:hypothetical protein
MMFGALILPVVVIVGVVVCVAVFALASTSWMKGNPFGYLIGVLVAVTVFDLSYRGWIEGNPFVSRFDLGWWLSSLLFRTVLCWVAALAPFLVVCKLAGPRAFAALHWSLVSGLLIALLTFPIELWFERGLRIGGNPVPYSRHFANIFGAAWPMLLLSGATFGLAYWWIERKCVPRWLEAHDRSADVANRLESASWPEISLHLRDWLRRRWLKLCLVATTLLLIGVVGRLWWPPHEPWWPQSASQTIPPIRLVNELKTINPNTVAWSPDETTLATYRDSPRALLLWDLKLNRSHASKLPVAMVEPPVMFLSGGDRIVAPAGVAKDTAFSILDAATRAQLHEVRGPHFERGHFNNAIKLAISSDRSVLAVAFGRQIPHPAVFYSTNDWSVIRVLDFAPGVRHTPDKLSFSGDGKRFALATLGTIEVVDTDTGILVRRIRAPGAVFGLALNHDGSMVLGQTGAAQVQVFTVSDGQMVSSYSTGRDNITGLDWDPRGQLVAIRSHSTLWIWNPAGGEKESKAIHMRRGGIGLAFSPSGSRLATVNDDHISVFEIKKP